jgi:bis(5'-nucleosidyl)-tetraphosphatase
MTPHNLTKLTNPLKQTSLSAGAVPIRNINGEWEVLLLRAFKYWDFPKGMVEEGEDPWDAALREIEEETGLSKFSTPFKKIFCETEPYGKGKVTRYYMVEIKEEKEIVFEANPVTGIVEHHEYRWVSFSEAHEMVVPRIQIILKWAADQIKKL